FERAVLLLKLHGSVATGEVIAPTWNKAISKRMSAVWQQAHDVLAAANQIRIVGYSLPVADAYIKYLVKSAVMTAPNLKRIDVICRDRTDQVASRYKDFVRFRYARFSNADVLQYLS